MGAILGALWTALRRSARTLGSFTTNNFFLVSLALLFMQDPGAFIALNFILGLVLFFPLSTDPLRKIPAVRLALWPLTGWERRLVRMASPWLNPMTWILAALVVGRAVTVGLWVVLAAGVAIGFVSSAAPGTGRGAGGWRWLPRFPGPLDLLIRSSLRQIFTTLDFYPGLLVSLGALIARMAGRLPAEARLPLTLLVVMAVSSYTQSLFGLERRAGLTRYRLLPLAGWQVLAAKGAAFLMVEVLLCLPLDPVAGLAAGLTALAMGNRTSVVERREQARWRFSTGTSFGNGIFQLLAMVAAAGAASAWWWVVGVCAGLCGWSWARYGSRFEHAI